MAEEMSSCAKVSTGTAGLSAIGITFAIATDASTDAATSAE
jgi:hypothetical protein